MPDQEITQEQEITPVPEIVPPQEIKHKYFNRKIIMLRGLHNLSLEEVSKITGKSVRTVASWLARPESKGYRCASEDSFNKLVKLYEEH